MGLLGREKPEKTVAAGPPRPRLEEFDPELIELLHQSPVFVLHGPQGAGKTTETVRAFPDCFFITHDKATYRSVASFIYDRWDEAQAIGLTKMPKIIELPKFVLPDAGDGRYAEGELLELDTMAAVEDLVNGYAEQVRQGTTKRPGLIFDEWSTILDQVKAQLDEKYRKGDFINGFAVNRELHQFCRRILEIARATRAVFGFVCHSSPPQYHEIIGEQAAKTPSVLRGKLKYRGGPKFPTGPLMEAFCARASFVFQLDLEAAKHGSDRLLRSEGDELWIRKGRSFAIPAETNLEDANLRDLLAQAGCIQQ